jgi:hypothetical protein
VLSRARIINRWFELNEVDVGVQRLDQLLDANVTRVDPKDEQEALTRALSVARTEGEWKRVFDAFVVEARRRDVPLVEDFPLAPEDESPDFRDLSMTLRLRAMRAHEHWNGNTKVTLGDVIYKLAGAS